MKSIMIKGLMLILIISMILCTSVKRTKTKIKSLAKVFSLAKTKTTDEGSGEWNEGFTNPRIEITQLGDNNNLKHETSEWFIATNNLDQMKEGLEITLNKPANNAVENEIFIRNAPGGQTYIPWRYINKENATYLKRSFSNKTITFIIDTDSGKNFKIVLVWAYKSMIGDIITPKECNIVKNKINEKRDEVKRILRGIKSDLINIVENLRIEQDRQNAKKLNAQIVVDTAKEQNKRIKIEIEELEIKFQNVKQQLAIKLHENKHITIRKGELEEQITRISADIENDHRLLDDKYRQSELANAANEIKTNAHSLKQEIKKIKNIASDANSIKNLNDAEKYAMFYKGEEMGKALDRVISTK